MGIAEFHEKVSDELQKIHIESDFKIMKNIKYAPKIVFIIGIFRLEDPYKADDHYKKGLEWILENFPKFFQSLSIRIYFDDSLLLKNDDWHAIYKRLLSSTCVELIKYNFPQFKYNATYHAELFGTVIRLLPIFAFDNIEETIMTIDADINDYNYYNLVIDLIKKYIEMVHKSETGILLRAYGIETFMDNTRLEIHELVVKHDFLVRFIMQFVTCSKKIDKNIFLRFMKCMLENCQSNKDWINVLISRTNCNRYDKLGYGEKYLCRHLEEIKSSKVGKFMYGIDEFLLNNFVVGSMINSKTGFVINFIFPSMVYYHYFIYGKLFKARKITLPFMQEFYKDVLKERYDDNIDKNFKFLDKIFYKKKKDYIDDAPIIYNQQVLEYFKKIYTFLHNAIKNGKLMKNISNVTSKERDYCKRYFHLIEEIPYSTLIAPRGFYEIKYQNKKNYKFVTL
jgi:hypothetical protein